MKLFLFTIFTFCFSISIYCQNKVSGVESTYHQWKQEDGCVDEWAVTFENNTSKHISAVTFRLVIVNGDNKQTIYKKTHTVVCSIGPGEVVPTPYFKLAQQLCIANRYDGQIYYNFYTEVVSVK